jgi:hypothetical protein
MRVPELHAASFGGSQCSFRPLANQPRLKFGNGSE